jgi:hypothetical protein
MESEKKYFGGWVVWVVVLSVGITLVGFGLKALGVFGERVMFEQSHQYNESRKSEIATYNAQLAEIERNLTNTSLEEGTRTNLEAQASAIRIQLETAKGK